MSDEQKTKTCPHCMEEIKWRAKICPNCRKKLNLSWAELTKFEKFVTVLLTIGLFIFLMSIFTGGENESPEATAQKQQEKLDNEKKLIGYVCAQQEVESQLVSPATAKHEPKSYTDLNFDVDGNVLILSYVDSQNGFGATIRTRYACRVTVTNIEKKTCLTECEFL